MWGGGTLKYLESENLILSFSQALTSCVALHKSLNLSDPESPYLGMWLIC